MQRTGVPDIFKPMVEGMYACGALRAGAFAFEHISFDEAVNKKVLGGNKSPLKRMNESDGDRVPKKQKV